MKCLKKNLWIAGEFPSPVMLAIIIYNDGAFMVLFVDFGVSLDFRSTLLL